MGQKKKNIKRIDFRMNETRWQNLVAMIMKAGYVYAPEGNPAPYWGAFAEALSDGVIADDGENIIFQIPYKKVDT